MVLMRQMPVVVPMAMALGAANVADEDAPLKCRYDFYLFILVIINAAVVVVLVAIVCITGFFWSSCCLSGAILAVNGLHLLTTKKM